MTDRGIQGSHDCGAYRPYRCALKNGSKPACKLLKTKKIVYDITSCVCVCVCGYVYNLFWLRVFIAVVLDARWHQVGFYEFSSKKFDTLFILGETVWSVSGVE